MRRRGFEEHQSCFENTTERERSHARDIGDRGNLPLAGRAIVVAPTRTAVMMLMIVDDAEDERHAHVQQAHDNACYAVFNHASGNLAVPQQKVKRPEPLPRRWLSGGTRLACLGGVDELRIGGKRFVTHQQNDGQRHANARCRNGGIVQAV